MKRCNDCRNEVKTVSFIYDTDNFPIDICIPCLQDRVRSLAIALETAKRLAINGQLLKKLERERNTDKMLLTHMYMREEQLRKGFENLHCASCYDKKVLPAWDGISYDDFGRAVVVLAPCPDCYKEER